MRGYRVPSSLIYKIEREALHIGDFSYTDGMDKVIDAIKDLGEVELDNPWNTGKPTDDGDYLVAFHPWGRKENGICYIGLKWEEDHWYDPVTDYFSEPYLVAWQKIEPYRG